MTNQKKKKNRSKRKKVQIYPYNLIVLKRFPRTVETIVVNQNKCNNSSEFNYSSTDCILRKEARLLTSHLY